MESFFLRSLENDRREAEFLEHLDTRRSSESDPQRPINILELNDRLSRIESFSERLYITSQDAAYRSAASIEEATSRLREVIDAAQSAANAARTSALSVKGDIQTASPDPSARREGLDVVREMTHALKTPLARISILSDTMVSTLSNEPEKQNQIKGIRSAVQVCQYYLDSFRASLSGGSFNLSGKDTEFKDSVRNAILTYISASEKKIGLHIDVPEKISLFPPYYAIATFLPLVENAIEASHDNDFIEILASEESKRLIVEIENQYHGRRPSDKMFEDGYTTKKSGGNEGLGLGIVRNFIAGLPGSTLTYSMRGRTRIVFTLVLESRA
jgi:K+-sensing histidine kinase KdpD